ncbi:mitogen-activated protein kinase-binding protein 1-like isoform X2 [Mercenaria mercenaria]|uniref:mitogen-activated protein kinase-binding protein 1-like isoform X2 n=1 Tax=Mercenaria mercenaria TaxID=6596 RepID=UPI00234F13C0|nr:mitogen-activated protein kinase-binding protein 1-like isoform X2 [Mercenaria mercenaria]
MDNKHPRKILKSPVAKRRSRITPKDQKVTLERVLGLTATSNATVACDPNSSIVAYPAGCVVVLYNPKKNKQGHIFNVSKKTLTSLAFSGDGKHLVTGESGHQPAVRVWDVAEKTQVAEFHGHKFGISCVAFSPNLKYIVSIGTQHDMQVNVWNWRTGSKVASNKVSSKVSAVSFSADGSYFVTVGMRHVKFWYLDSSKSKINSITLPLNGRNGILGDHRNNFFCDVAAGTGSLEKSTFCVTQSGYLCQFNEKRQMEKWVELRTTCANAISVAGNYIFVGCANGIVRVFNSSTLHFVATLPRPHYLGVDIAAAVNPSQLNSVKDGDIKYPDTIAIQYDEEHNKVTCIYNDHSMYIWDVHDLKKIGKAWSFLYHSSCVYGVEVYPVLEAGLKSVLPPHSFFTCSSDDTIRIWNLDPHMAETSTYKSNIYTHDLLKVMYMDPSLTSLCDIDYNPSGATDKTDTNYDDKNGIRSIRVSPDGQHLASGDRQGNVRIHELENLIEIKQIEAHESEVLCLEYSRWKNGPKLLASSSRDRLIHVFDTEQQYGLLQTLSDHSSSISAVKFTETDNQMKMISCGADKSILFRNLQQDPEFQFTLATHQVEKMTLYDMVVEPTQKFSAIACQDRNVRIYNIKTGKKKKEYKGSLSDDGTLLKMKLDPSGTFAATSCSDKNMCIIDFYSGELQATMFGHSEIATDVRFMNDLRHLISTSGDGCIFVWRLPQEMTSQMQNRLKEMGQILPHITNGGLKLEPLKAFKKDEVDASVAPEREFFSPERALKEMYPSQYNGNSPSPSPKDNLDYRFSISQLPSWAKKKFEGGGDGLENVPNADDDTGSGTAPRGRWAQRAEGQGPTIKTQDGKSVEVDPSADRRRISYQGEFSTGQVADMRRETMVLNRPSTTPTNMPVIFDDMNDDDDDDFLPVSSKTFVKQDTQEKSDVTWDDLYNFDADDNEQDKTQIIYYPPSESDGSDTLPSSYQVFDAGLSADRPPRQLKHSISMNSNPDADSESTDPVSLEDVEDEDDSMPGTPMDDVPKSQNREKFLKDTFENLSFTPGLPTDKFVKGLDTLEEEMATNQATGAINSRQSLSARFLSKSQAANLRNMGPYGNIQRQDNWFDLRGLLRKWQLSVQRRKDDMARNLDESRKMLMAMGWKQESPETDGDDPFTEPHTSPTSPQLDSTPTLIQGEHSGSDDNSPTNLALHLREQPDPPPSPRTPKTLRRCWSNFDLPKSPIPEGKPIKLSTPKTLERSVSSSNFSSSKSSGHQQTPTSRKSLSSTARPRTLPLDKSGGRVTPTDKSASKTQGRVRKDTPTAPQPSGKLSEYKKNSRLSTPNLSKVQVVSPEPRRMSAGSNLSKSKSNSMNNLLADDEEQELTPRGTNRRPRSKWSTSKMTSFASVPNLLNPDDDGKISVSNSQDSDLSDRSKQDINDNVINERKGGKRAGAKSPQVGDSTLKSTKRAASTGRLSGELKSNTDEKKGLNKRVASSVTNLKTVGNQKSKDRDLMPPPAVPNVAKTKQETRFMKRAQQQRRKTTGTAELTFEEAKNILKGNSGILNGKKEKEKRSSSTSPSRNRSSLSSVESGLTSSDIGEITDPALFNAATEIEMTAAEIRRKSTPSSSMHSGLEASPQDLPERDIPPERDTSRAQAKTSSSAKIISVKPHPLKGTDMDISGGSKNSPRDSGLFTEEDEECPSPSVKERIARLNKHVDEPVRKQTHSPYRGQHRSESPDWEGSRQTSSIQINFSSPSTVSSSSSQSGPALDASETASSDTMTASSHVTPQRLSSSDHTESFHSVSQPLRDHMLQHHQLEGTSHLSGGSMMSTSAQSLSPPSGLISSLDSEGLSHHLSPGNHSNTSPRSVADTGLGSDTDLENSHTFRRDQLLAQADPHSIVLESLDQIQSAIYKMTQTFPKLQDREDVRVAEVRKQCRERLPAMIETLCNTVGLSPPGNHDNEVSVSRQAIDSLYEQREALNNLYQQITDIHKYVNPS